MTGRRFACTSSEITLTLHPAPQIMLVQGVVPQETIFVLRTLNEIMAVAARATSNTVLALFENTVASASGLPAVEDELTALSFAELLDRVGRAATVLTEAGVGYRDRVALWLPNSVGFVESFLAVLACGATAFPLAQSARAAEVRRLLEETPVNALIAAARTECALAPEAAACLVSGLDGLRIESGARGRGERALPQPQDPALIAHSSGTTGRAHTVVRTHENLWWEAENFWSATRLGSGDVILGVIPLSHAHGLGNALLACLRAGSRLVLRTRFLRRQTLDLLADKRVTVFPTVPFMLRMLAATDRRRAWDLGALRLCCSAGAPLAKEVYEGFLKRFRVPARQLYGLTEAGSVTLNTAAAAELDPTSVGTPLGSVKITIEDSTGREVGAGESGEIVVHSPAAVGGASTPLRTRDHGRWSARGELVITGRTSLFINAAGNKIDPTEVEAVLRLHPAVADVAVFGLPAGQGEQLVAASIVPRSPCSAEGLRLHCRRLLAGHKVPRVLRFRSALPRSPLGKVLIDRLLAET